MNSATPRRIILGGPLSGPGMSGLIAYCDQLHASGVTRLYVDMSDVTDCQRAGLDGLWTLASGRHPEVVITGAHWEQFMTMLSTEPIIEVQGLAESVQKLLRIASAP